MFVNIFSRTVYTALASMVEQKPFLFYTIAVMLNRFYYYINPDNDPYKTLALEEYMMEHAGAEDIVFYLYTHADTVVIGRNQNAWAECRHEQLAADGGKLARRISGGGAVFHDYKNLNFSFITSRENYDLRRQLSVILAAVRRFGVEAEFSGRNDILAGGRKFSGNAFCNRRGNAFHHGTIMIDTDTGKLSKYLAGSRDKIASKGIASVRSRVVNLSELNPAITHDAMEKALVECFEQEYGPAERYQITPEAAAAVEKLAERNQSWEWLFGESPRFDITASTRFGWGGFELNLELSEGTVKNARVYSDAMDADLIGGISGRLAGCAFTSRAPLPPRWRGWRRRTASAK
jgi:lipoate-protein ligase A